MLSNAILRKGDEIDAKFIGKYKEIPVHIIDRFDHNEYKCQIVSYLLTKEEIDEKIYRIVGILVEKDNNIISSYDMIYCKDDSIYQYIVYDILDGSMRESVKESFENYPSNDLLIERLLESFLNNYSNQ